MAQPASSTSRSHRSRTWLTAILVTVGAFALFRPGIGNPPTVIFDEAKYVEPARALLASTHDISPDGPPLGKLIVAASIKLLGDSSLGWRAASAVFGAITLTGVFLFLQILLDDYGLALAGVAITLFNNFLYVLSRAAMMDIFLVAFALWGILAFTIAIKLEHLEMWQRRALLLASGALLGLACASKWNGIDEVCVVLAIGMAVLFLGGNSRNPEVLVLREHLQKAGAVWFALSFLLVPFVVYLAVYWPYCLLLHLPFSRSQLLAMNLYIWRFHRAVPPNPTIVDPWYRWPIRTEPMRALSYLVGNWYVMWFGLIAWAYCLRRFARSLPETLIVLLYAANFLQWAVTPQGALYYYYYFPAAIFLGMTIVVALHRLPQHVYGVRLSVAAVLPAACIFIYCFGRMANLPPPFDCTLGCWH
jgi:dolichyl-phosphate-mannose-protein mannosyltransferase